MLSGPARAEINAHIARLKGIPTSIYTKVVTKGGDFAQLSGRRAAGGPVSASGTYLVGEQGPEFIRRNGTGTGSGGVTLNATFNVSGATSPEMFSRDALLALRRELTRNGMSLA